MIKVIKIITVLAFFILTANIHSSETKMPVSFSYLNSESFKITSFKFNSAEFYNKIPQKAFIRTGIVLTVTGGAALIAGGLLTGLSYYFAWCAVADYLGTTDFEIKEWYFVWQFVFMSVGYRYSTAAALSLIIGISLSSLCVILIPGIILLTFGLLARKFAGGNVSILSDSIGFSIKF